MDKTKDLKILSRGHFACGLVAKNPGFHCRNTGLIPGWGTKIPHVCGMAKKYNI